MLRPNENRPADAGLGHLLAYVAELELEVDRLRRHHQLIYLEARALTVQIHDWATAEQKDPRSLVDAGQRVRSVLEDLREVPGYHPAHDQVVAIALRPLAEQVFRWQQRLLGVSDVKLLLESEVDHLEWFPARLRHILNSLISNALRFRDGSKDDCWVRLSVRETAEGYELRLSDNGRGLPGGMHNLAFDLMHRASPARATGLGLAVVRMLVEQSGGSFTAMSGDGQGTTVIASLPRFAIDDFLV